VLDRVVFNDLTLHSVFAKSRLTKVRQRRLPLGRRCAQCVRNNKTRSELSVHQDGGRPRTGIPKILEAETIIAETSMP
jgi:hypothetical protein